MNTRHALVRLVELQDVILTAIADAERSLRALGQDAHPHLARQRWLLARLLREYQLFKHIEIFEPAIGSGNLGRAALAQAMKGRCIAAGETYHRHVRHWTAEAIERGWADYAAAVLAVGDSIRLHIARERRDVEGFLAGTQRTRGPVLATPLRSAI